MKLSESGNADNDFDFVVTGDGATDRENIKKAMAAGWTRDEIVDELEKSGKYSRADAVNLFHQIESQK